MRETPAAFARRAGAVYAPPSALTAVARPLAADEPCPTLFRYPGPLGLLALLAAARTRLGPGERPYVWLASRADAMSGSALFGAVAILEPLRLQPCLADEAAGHWLARDAEVHLSDTHSVWVPPSAVARALPWDTLREASEVRDAVGAAYAAELQAVAVALGAYAEEMFALRVAGAAGPAGPWHEVSVDERRRLLARAGIEGRWTR